MVVTFTAKC